VSRTPSEFRDAEVALNGFVPPAEPPVFVPPYPDPPPETPNGLRAQRWYQYMVAARLRLTRKQSVRAVLKALRVVPS